MGVDQDPWRSPDGPPTGSPPAGAPAGAWGPPGGQQTALAVPPWQAEQGWQVVQRRSNPAATTALVLGVASVLPGVGVGAVVAGVLGLLRARATGGRGRAPSVVGLVLGALSLVVWAAVALAVVAGALAGAPSARGGALDPSDRADGSLSAAEQAYLDGLSDVTYLNFTDEDLVAMGDLACRDLRAGTSADEDSDRLGDRYAAGQGDAWDVQRTATATLCPDAAGALDDQAPPAPTV